MFFAWGFVPGSDGGIGALALPSAIPEESPVTAIRLETKRVEKPWGRHDLWPGFDDAPADGPAIGEVWFQAPKGVGEDDPELLIKYLFTSQKLSVQVHPDDVEARARGYERGKSEAWQILSADPHATIGLGMLKPMTKDELRASAEDGSIEHLMDWKSVQAGQFWYSPAGMIHAIGPGLVLVEIQQNVDLTYRLYDYGSDRELHLKDGVAVADPVPFRAAAQRLPHHNESHDPRRVAEVRHRTWPAGRHVVDCLGAIGSADSACRDVADGVAFQPRRYLTVDRRCQSQAR